MIDPVAKGFDRLAPFYDTLARFTIGKGIVQSQARFLDYLEGRNKLLVLGGGTGWILPLILKRNPSLKIDYIDLSARMISRAKEKVKSQAGVRFITGTEGDIPDTDYDCLITNFYLDLFAEEKLPGLINHLRNHLQKDGYWLATDFVKEKTWHKIILWIMYRFFRWTTELKTSGLSDWDKQLAKQGVVIESQNFTQGFIKSVVIRF